MCGNRKEKGLKSLKKTGVTFWHVCCISRVSYNKEFYMSQNPVYRSSGLWSIPGVLPFFLVGFFNAFVDLGHKIAIQNTVFKVYDGPGLVLRTAVIQAMVLLPFLS